MHKAIMFPSTSFNSGLRGSSSEWIHRINEQEYFPVDLTGSSSSGEENEALSSTDPYNYSVIFTALALSILFVVGICIVCIRKSEEQRENKSLSSLTRGDTSAEVDDADDEYKRWF